MFEDFPGVSPDIFSHCKWIDGKKKRKRKAGGGREGKRQRVDAQPHWLRIVCATNNSRRPSNPSRWPAAGRGREGEGSGRCCCVYKPDRWSAAPTRTIKLKTTGCFFLAEPGFSAAFQRSSCKQSRRDGLMKKIRREGGEESQKTVPLLPPFSFVSRLR